MKIRRPLLEHAQLYARHGLKVFRAARLVYDDDDELICSCWRGSDCPDPGKHPKESGWQDADQRFIFRWWGLGGEWNVGVITGAPSGIVVLDIDPRHGGDETLAALEPEHGELPITWKFRTGSGGEHLLFKHPGGRIPNGTNVLGAGIDIRGDGGLIIAPPSLHVSGREYAIDVDGHPDDVPLADLPDWLLTTLKVTQKRRVRNERPVRACTGLNRYGEVALDNACERILAASNGEQEAVLNRECYSIGRLAGAGAGLPPEFALSVLLYCTKQITDFEPRRPWRDSELERKVERSFNAGTRNPRRVR